MKPSVLHRSLFVGVAALAFVAFVWLPRERAPSVAFAERSDAAEARGSSPVLASPEAIPATPGAPAERRDSSAPESEATRKDVLPSATGALEAHVLLDPSFAGARKVALLVPTPPNVDPNGRGVIVQTASESSAQGEPQTFSFHRDGLGRVAPVSPLVRDHSAPVLQARVSEPQSGCDLRFTFVDVPTGAYELRLTVVGREYPDDPLAWFAAQENPYHTVVDLWVEAGETTRDPRLDPLDLRGKHVLAQFTLVDGFGVSRAGVDCRAMVGLSVRVKATSDRDGEIDFVLPTRAASAEFEIERLHTCVVRAPIVLGRSVLVIPDRPVYVLHVDPDCASTPHELSVFVRESEALAADSALGRGAVWGRFDTAGDALVTPRRLGPHELEWRVKRADGRVVSLVDPRQSLDVRAAASAQFVALDPPADVLAALR